MASISKLPNGRKMIQFLEGKKRRTIRLGKMSAKDAEAFKRNVEQLQSSRGANLPQPVELTRWVAGLSKEHKERLLACDLIDPPPSLTVADWTQGEIDRKKATYKPGTVVRLQQSRKSLVGHAGKGRSLLTYTAGDAQEYRDALLAQGMAEATVRKRCSDASAWFAHAVEKNYLQGNPFSDIPKTALATQKLFYIRTEVAVAVMNEFPTLELRLLFALARWGGLRVPSEPRCLEWPHVKWDQERIKIISPKTARYGKVSRIIPMFPELKPLLQEAFEQAEPGERYVLPTMQKRSGTMFRKQLIAAIERAGFEPWDRVWQNLRSTRQTELTQEAKYRQKVVNTWLGTGRTDKSEESEEVCQIMGNTPAVADASYQQVTEADWDRAVEQGGSRSAALQGALHGALQNAQQHMPVHGGTARHETRKSPGNTEKTRHIMEQGGTSVPPCNRSNDPYGISENPSNEPETPISGEGAAECAAPFSAWLDSCPFPLSSSQRQQIDDIVAGGGA